MGSLEDLTFRGGGVTKNQYIGGGLPKNMGGGPGQFVDSRGGLARKRRGGGLRGGVDTPMPTMVLYIYNQFVFKFLHEFLLYICIYIILYILYIYYIIYIIYICIYIILYIYIYYIIYMYMYICILHYTLNCKAML